VPPGGKNDEDPGMKKMVRPISTIASESGITLLETMIALVLLLIITVGMLSMTLTAIATTENQGHLSARTAEYAQDKMEQLLALSYGDSTTDTTLSPAASSGGSGLSPGGTLSTTSPLAGYVDFLDAGGNLLTSVGGTAPTGWFYVRVWQISTPSGTTNLKLISVRSQSKTSVGSMGSLPESTVAIYKTSPF
jgi:hypothetical protein